MTGVLCLGMGGVVWGGISNVAEIRLQYLIEHALAPFISIDVYASHMSDRKGIKVTIEAENFGNNPAIEPWIIFHEVENFQEIFEDINLKDVIHLEHQQIKSLRAGEKSDRLTFEFPYTEERLSEGTHNFLVEVVYLTLNGDYLSDISELEVHIEEFEDAPRAPYKTIEYNTSFTTKRYRSNDYFQTISNLEASQHKQIDNIPQQETENKND